MQYSTKRPRESNKGPGLRPVSLDDVKIVSQQPQRRNTLSESKVLRGKHLDPRNVRFKDAERAQKIFENPNPFKPKRKRKHAGPIGRLTPQEERTLYATQPWLKANREGWGEDGLQGVK